MILSGQTARMATQFSELNTQTGARAPLASAVMALARPNGITEGAIATKNFVTYWDAEAPVGGVNADRTSFHIER